MNTNKQLRKRRFKQIINHDINLPHLLDKSINIDTVDQNLWNMPYRGLTITLNEIKSKIDKIIQFEVNSIDTESPNQVRDDIFFAAIKNIQRY